MKMNELLARCGLILVLLGFLNAPLEGRFDSEYRWKSQICNRRDCYRIDGFAGLINLLGDEHETEADEAEK